MRAGRALSLSCGLHSPKAIPINQPLRFSRAGVRDHPGCLSRRCIAGGSCHTRDFFNGSCVYPAEGREGSRGCRSRVRRDLVSLQTKKPTKELCASSAFGVRECVKTAAAPALPCGWSGRLGGRCGRAGQGTAAQEARPAPGELSPLPSSADRQS